MGFFGSLVVLDHQRVPWAIGELNQSLWGPGEPATGCLENNAGAGQTGSGKEIHRRENPFYRREKKVYGGIPPRTSDKKCPR